MENTRVANMSVRQSTGVPHLERRRRVAGRAGRATDCYSSHVLFTFQRTVKRFVKEKKEEKENIVKKENVENGKYSKRRRSKCSCNYR
jgi:hypothetical protein